MPYTHIVCILFDTLWWIIIRAPYNTHTHTQHVRRIQIKLKTTRKRDTYFDMIREWKLQRVSERSSAALYGLHNRERFFLPCCVAFSCSMRTICIICNHNQYMPSIGISNGNGSMILCALLPFCSVEARKTQNIPLTLRRMMKKQSRIAHTHATILLNMWMVDYMGEMAGKL